MQCCWFCEVYNLVFKVRVTNVLDKSIGDASVTAKEFITADESVTLFDNKAFTKSNSKDDVITVQNEVARGYVNAHAYDLDVMSANPKRGMFRCKIVVSVKDGKQFVKETVYELKVKVLARVMVEDVDVAIGEKDQALGKAVKYVCLSVQFPGYFGCYTFKIRKLIFIMSACLQ